MTEILTHPLSQEEIKAQARSWADVVYAVTNLTFGAAQQYDLERCKLIVSALYGLGYALNKLKWTGAVHVARGSNAQLYTLVDREIARVHRDHAAPRCEQILRELSLWKAAQENVLGELRIEEQF